jgi:hypothetical protein
LPRRLEAAAGPSSDPGGYDYGPDRQVISIPANTQVKDSVRLWSLSPGSDDLKFRDPLHLLLDYIAEVSNTNLVFFLCYLQIRLILTWIMQQATDCDSVLVHDDDLGRIGGLGDNSVSELLNSNRISPHFCSRSKLSNQT